MYFGCSNALVEALVPGGNVKLYRFFLLLLFLILLLLLLINIPLFSAPAPAPVPALGPASAHVSVLASHLIC